MFKTREVWVVIFQDGRGIHREIGEFQSEKEAVLLAHEMMASYTAAWVGYAHCTIEHRVVSYRE